MVSSPSHFPFKSSSLRNEEARELPPPALPCPVGAPTPANPTQHSIRGTLPSPQIKHSRGERFPIPGKPRLSSIQPQNNPRAGCQLPLPPSRPIQAGDRQCMVVSRHPSAPHAGQALGRMESPHHGLIPHPGFLQPCAPFLPHSRAAPVKNRRRALS